MTSTENPIYPVKQWKQEVGEGHTILGYEAWAASLAERDAAKNPEAPATREFTFRIRATARVENESVITATSLEEACQMAAAIDPTDYRWGYSYTNDDDIEGDEIGYVSDPDDDLLNEVEVDLRKPGEPFSWLACDIVKELAKLHDESDGIKALEADELIQRAHDICHKREEG